MEKIGNLFSTLPQPVETSRRTERGDLLDTFLARLNPPRVKEGYKPLTYGRLSYLLTAVPTKDLYALQARCDDAERHGYPWSAIFWKELKPKKLQVIEK